MSIKEGLMGLVLGFGALNIASKVYAQETPETPVIEQQEKTYQSLEQELRSLLQRFIGHDKSLLPTLEQKLEETKSRLNKETPSDLSTKLDFLDTVKRDLDDYKVQFSTYEEAFKTLTDMLDKVSKGEEVPGLAAKISFLNRTKTNKLTNPYMMAPKQDLFNLIDEIYKAESQRKKSKGDERTSTIQKKFEKIIPKDTEKEKLAEGKRSANIPTGAVLYMTFDKGTVVNEDGKWIVKDLSSKGNDGIIYGNFAGLSVFPTPESVPPEFDLALVRGPSGKPEDFAMYFAGKNGYIEVKDDLNSFPLEILVKFIATDSSTRQYLISSDNPTRFGIGLGIKGRQFEIDYHNGFQSLGKVEENNLDQLRLVYTNDIITIYRGNIILGTITAHKGNVPDGRLDYWIGACNNDPGYRLPFKGIVETIAVIK